MCAFRYKSLIFDCYGCLLAVKTDENNPMVWERLARYYKEAGVSYQADE